MMITIVDYDAGNLTSVARAVTHLGQQCIITPDAEKVASAERIIFPGVGAAGSAMETLRSRGLDQALRDSFSRGTPILGICLGAQVIVTESEEDNTPCLDLIPGRVTLLRGGGGIKVPHMGWNSVQWKRRHPVIAGLPDECDFYFVHSYCVVPGNDSLVIGTTEHGVEFASVVGRDNLIACQFHPEKSAGPGLKILDNFFQWDGSTDAS